MTLQSSGFVEQFGPFDPQTFPDPAQSVHRLHLELASLGSDAEAADDDACNVFLTSDAQTDPQRLPQRNRLAQSRLVALRRRAVRKSNGPTKRWPRPAGHTAEDLRAMRAHFYCDTPVEEPEKYSLPLRLAGHSINMSLIVAALPIGAAAMTYTLLRGDDMTFTARLTTLTGLALAIFGGDHGAAFLGII